MPKINIIRNHLIVREHNKPVLVDVYYPRSGETFPAVIFSHGFKGFKDWGPFDLIAHQFALKGIVFIKFNFSYNGTTPEDPLNFVDLDAFGNNNFTRELDDLDTVISFLMENQTEFNADVNNITLIGHSRGGGISILKGAEDSRIARLITWASVADLSRHITKNDVKLWKKSGVFHVENTRTGQMMPLYIQLYNDFIRNHRRFSILNAVKMLSKPMLAVHGTLDDTVPFEHAVELHELNFSYIKLVKVMGGGHTFGASHPLDTNSLPSDFQLVVDESLRFILENQ